MASKKSVVNKPKAKKTNTNGINAESVTELSATILVALGIGSDVSPTDIYEDDFTIVRGMIHGYLKQHGVI